ncbi:sensor histidine kinase [Neobacillus drentensis]|uniref:sensor histidine kinase n=1 Tax=Neobacillus drentensis TaxID=220684 RepID=UPI001F33902C|nr:sensor histidine kinase [Neobacillus drentensis]ULT56158.1 sensor histidine kinase [Neobacillus drentensis]
MKKKKFSFHNVRLSKKLLIMYIFSVLIPIVLTNIIFYTVTINNVKQQQMHDSELALNQISHDFGKIIDDAVGISSSLYTNTNINLFLEKEYLSDADYVDDYNTYLRTFNQSSPINPSINSIRFYTDNPTIIYSGGVYPLTEEIKKSNWYRQIMGSSITSPIVLRSSVDDQTSTFSIIRKLDYFNFNNKQKIVKIEINPATIENIFNNVTFKGDVYLLNEKGEIEYSTKKDLGWRKKVIPFRQISNKKKADILDSTYLDQSYLLNWKLVGTVSEKKMLNTVNKSGRFILYLAFINIIIPSIIIILINRSFLRRLQRIFRHVKKMGDQNFEKIPDPEYTDEIGTLTSEFNRMIRKIEELIQDVFMANIQKQEMEIKRNRAQLSALQSQINPHFLFNALETIRMRSLMKEEIETAKIIHNMAKIFRNSLTWGKDMVTVREEINLIISFLEIQKYRFGDKLDYEIHIDHDADECIIPNMALQPFIENASIHGIEPLKENGKIEVHISIEDDLLVCKVMDNGVGMSESKTQQLIKELENENDMGKSVGIKNVYYRLKLYYQDQFHFQLDSREGEGTVIIIKIPNQTRGISKKLNF